MELMTESKKKDGFWFSLVFTLLSGTTMTFMILDEKAIIIELSISINYTKKYFLTTKLACFAKSHCSMN